MVANLYVMANGIAQAETYNTMVSLSGQYGAPALLDADGSALLIHENPDDYKTQPIGGSGGRVACAVFK